MHSLKIMHRDLKPSNLLIGYDGILKITDFGLCRIFYPDDEQRTYSHQVCTRYYRPPEILFGAKRYGPAVDVWSAGAIAAELIEGIPLLPGINDIDQISKTFAAFGYPDDERWEGFSSLPDAGKIQFSRCAPQPIEDLVPRLAAHNAKDSSDFIARLMSLNPARRPTAADALAHPYFSPAARPPAASRAASGSSR